MKSKLLFLITIVVFDQASASFRELWIRYPPPPGTISLLKQAFPFAAEDLSRVSGCLKISRENAGLLGVSSATDGLPVNAEPGIGFQIWYLKCLIDLVNAETKNLPQDQSYWKDISAEKRKVISTDLLLKHLGPEQSYQYLGLQRRQKQLEQQILTGVQQILGDKTSENMKFLKQMDIDPKNPKMVGVIKIMKILILSLDEFILE
jgi:hypothetical protein